MSGADTSCCWALTRRGAEVGEVEVDLLLRTAASLLLTPSTESERRGLARIVAQSLSVSVVVGEGR